MSRIILQPHAGGLGDYLLYSTLPKLYHDRGDQVWLSSLMPTRNPETLALFLLNPYIKGVVDEPGNVPGDDMIRDNRLSRVAMRCRSGIEATEKIHGLEASGFLCPNIYYEPKFQPEFRNAILVDPCSISQQYPVEKFAEFVNHLSRWLEFDPNEILVIANRFNPVGAEYCPNRRRIMVSSVFEYADLLHSCKYFLCVNSGSHSLASAVQALTRPHWHGDRRIFTLTTSMVFNEHFFVFPNVQYLVTGGLTPDFHSGVYG